MRVRLTVTGRAKVASGPFRVGGQGKPVQLRRGPATVTGDATREAPPPRGRGPPPGGARRRSSHWTADGGPGRRGAVGPGARRPAPTARLISPSWKGVALMLHRLAGLALAVLALLAFAGTAAAAPVTVNLRVEGATRTLFEGPVTTDAKAALATPSSGGPHPCDVGENLVPATATRAGAPTTAL